MHDDTSQMHRVSCVTFKYHVLLRSPNGARTFKYPTRALIPMQLLYPSLSVCFVVHYFLCPMVRITDIASDIQLQTQLVSNHIVSLPVVTGNKVVIR